MDPQPPVTAQLAEARNDAPPGMPPRASSCPGLLFWLLAATLCMAGLIAGGFLGWMGARRSGDSDDVPPGAPFALVQVTRQPKYLVFPPCGPEADKEDYERFVQTQVALMRSRIVVEAALREPKVCELPSVKAQLAGDPVVWLVRTLRVRQVPNSELVQISIALDNAGEAATVVNGVVDAYLKEIVGRDRDERNARLCQLDKLCEEHETCLRQKRTDMKNLAEMLHCSPDPDKLSFQQQAILDHYKLQRENLMRVNYELARAEGQLKATRDLLDRKRRVLEGETVGAGAGLPVPELPTPPKEPVPPKSVSVPMTPGRPARLTYTGDANPSGPVATDDFGLWRYGYAENLPATWYSSDFDYEHDCPITDGKVLELLHTDPQSKQVAERLGALGLKLAEAKASAAGDASKNQEQIKKIEKEIVPVKALYEELASKMRRRIAQVRIAEIERQVERLEADRVALLQVQSKCAADVDEARKEAQMVSGRSIELQMLNEEVKQLAKMLAEIADTRDKFRVERHNQSPISLRSRAVAPY